VNVTPLFASVIRELIFAAALPFVLIAVVAWAGVVLFAQGLAKKDEAERKVVVGKVAAMGIKWTILLANLLLKKRF